MKFTTILIICKFLSFASLHQCVSQQLVVDYFKTLTPTKIVRVQCPEPYLLLQELNRNGIQWTLNKTSHGGVYANLDHDNLVQPNFNSSFYWLIEGENPENLVQYDLQVDSHVTFVDKNQTLFDVWASSASSLLLHMEKFAYWNGTTFIITDKLNKRNLTGTELRTTIYVPDISAVQNVSTALINRNFTKEGTSFDILLQVKYFHSLNLVLKDKLNFTVVITKITEDIENYDYLQDSDIVSAGALMTVDKIENFSFIYSDFRIIEDLFYLLTPQLVSDRDYLTFLSPLDYDVWVVFTFFLLIISALIKVFGSITKDENVEVIIQVVGTVAMQGITPVPENTALRIALLSGLVLMLVLFNLYTASLLGVILTPPKDKFQSSAEVVSSTELSLSRIDNYYSRYGLNEKVAELGQAFPEIHFDDPVKKKHSKAITIFMDPNEGLEKVKSSPVALCGDSLILQGAIHKKFKSSEICDLRKQSVMNQPMYMILPKGSQFNEMFRVVMMRAFEAGLTDRNQKIYSSEMPPCLAGVTIYSVPLSKVSGAIYLLFGGFIVSLVLFLIEKLRNWEPFKRRINSKIFQAQEIKITDSLSKASTADLPYVP